MGDRIKKRELIIKEARKVLEIESNTIRDQIPKIDDSFVRLIEEIVKCKGKVIISGVGKSGLVGKKIAATLSSIGITSLFLHPTDIAHGDLGVIKGGDILIIISNSGNTSELVHLVDITKGLDIQLVGLIGNRRSRLAKEVDIFIDTEIEREACSMNLIPTASTTLVMAIGDAIAVVCSIIKKVEPRQVALYHPGGELGRRLRIKVSAVMHSGNENPVVPRDWSMKDTLIEMTSKAMGAVSVVNGKGKIEGIITDGDLRRALQKYSNILEMKAEDIMNPTPIVIDADATVNDALQLMENGPRQILVLPVVDREKRVVGIVRLHDLVQTHL